jgi:hypothetical protein
MIHLYYITCNIYTAAKYICKNKYQTLSHCYIQIKLSNKPGERNVNRVQVAVVPNKGIIKNLLYFLRRVTLFLFLKKLITVSVNLQCNFLFFFI